MTTVSSNIKIPQKLNSKRSRMKHEMSRNYPSELSACARNTT
jgi:hypothetical protein